MKSFNKSMMTDSIAWFFHQQRTIAALLTITAMACLRVFPVAAGNSVSYTNDRLNSSLVFSFIQAGAENSGKFMDFSTQLELDDGGNLPIRLEVDVDVNSLNTQDDVRDGFLRGPDLFHVEKFPKARFESSKIVMTEEGFSAIGNLTIRGISKNVTIPFKIKPFGGERNGRKFGYMEGKVSINRMEFGVGQGEWSSDAWVGNTVTISYQVRLNHNADLAGLQNNKLLADVN